MIRERENYNAFLLHFLERLNSCDSIEKKITESLTDICEYYGFSSYLVWVGVKFSNAKEEELLINDASQIGSKKFDFSIE